MTLGDSAPFEGWLNEALPPGGRCELWGQDGPRTRVRWGLPIGPGQFAVRDRDGLVRVNGLDGGAVLQARYMGIGTPVRAEVVNRIQERVEDLNGDLEELAQWTAPSLWRSFTVAGRAVTAEEAAHVFRFPAARYPASVTLVGVSVCAPGDFQGVGAEGDTVLEFGGDVSGGPVTVVLAREELEVAEEVELPVVLGGGLSVRISQGGGHEGIHVDCEFVVGS